MTRIDPSPPVDDHPDDVGSPARPPDWRHAYARRLVVTDLIALSWAVLGSAMIMVDLDSDSLAGPAWLPDPIGYPLVVAGVVLCWFTLLAAVGSRDYRKIGTGTAEYKAILQSGALTLVGIALLTFLLQVEFSRGFVLLAVPAGLLALIASRTLWRSWLRGRRRLGHFSARVLVVGSVVTAGQIASDLRRSPDAGYWVVGAVVSTGPGSGTDRVGSDGVDTSGSHDTGGRSEAGDTLPGTPIPVLGGIDELHEAVRRSAADTVLVVGGHNLTPAQMRRLSWSLEPGRQHLVVAPSLTDIAGPRIRSRPVAGLPLVHVETPRYEGLDRVAKRGFDILVAGGLLLLFSLPLLTVAAIVAGTSRGGVFFSHERIGQNGKPFRMLKFRSMVADADSHLQKLLEKQGSSDKPLFKITDDPRITRIGAIMRRYSIDEIPQLINVLRGDMSLVGPRPQVAKEVALYDDAAWRRLIAKPGMTGLWQVSGRSNLSWHESVRLDLYYVENWSLTADLAILFRTVRAVVASDGAV